MNYIYTSPLVKFMTLGLVSGGGSHRDNFDESHKLSYPDRTFQLVSNPYPDPVMILHHFFSNILDIIYSFVFPACKCVRFHIMMRYKIFRDIIL